MPRVSQSRTDATRQRRREAKDALFGGVPEATERRLAEARRNDLFLAWLEDAQSRTPHPNECDAPHDAPTVEWIVVNE